jgi:hypothetical protein
VAQKLFADSKTHAQADEPFFLKYGVGLCDMARTAEYYNVFQFIANAQSQ